MALVLSDQRPTLLTVPIKKLHALYIKSFIMYQIQMLRWVPITILQVSHA